MSQFYTTWQMHPGAGLWCLACIFPLSDRLSVALHQQPFTEQTRLCMWHHHQRKMLNAWLSMRTSCTLVKDLWCQVPLVLPIQFSPLLTFMFSSKVGHRGGNIYVFQIKTRVIIIMISLSQGKHLPGPHRRGKLLCEYSVLTTFFFFDHRVFCAFHIGA